MLGFFFFFTRALFRYKYKDIEAAEVLLSGLCCED